MKSENRISFVLRLMLVAVGAAATVNGIVLCFTSNFNIGNLLTLLLGTVLLVWGMFAKQLARKLPVWFKLCFCAGLAVLVSMVSFLLCFGTSDTITAKEDAIIVLGAAIHGERPSLTLRDRLDTALEYHSKNPDAFIVVSGGKGPQESITEALAMERYLLENGVSQERIIKEEKATSTYENFIYSKEILDKRLGKDYSVAFISNEYHIYRAQGIAKTAEYGNNTYYHCPTRWYSLLPGVLRECLAVVKFSLLGR